MAAVEKGGDESVPDSGVPAPQLNGVIDDEEDERLKMRPADIDADMREMERRKRVESIMNSRIFREELERIIESQMKDGSNSAGLLQEISEMFGAKYYNSNGFTKYSGCIIPINDIRGVESMGYSKGEKILRCKLAALFRLVDAFGWSKGIDNDITARLSQQEEHFLVQPYGLLCNEVTASSLVKVDMRGNVVEPGTTNYTVNVNHFQLHAAIYSARPDLKCIVRIDTPSVITISGFKTGLLPLVPEAAVIGDVSQHPYTGLSSEQEEKDKIVRNLGPNNKVMFLTNQGAVCCGETVEEAFFNVRNLVKACDAQFARLHIGVDNFEVIPKETRKILYDNARKIPEGFNFPPSNLPSGASVEKKWRVGGLEFEAMMRLLDNAGFRTGYIYRYPLIRGEPPRPRNDIEVPPAVSSLGYLLEEEENYKHGPWKKYGKGGGRDRIRWLNSPNVYQKVEILETGTSDPKKITKWVGANNEEWVADGSPVHASTPVKIENALQFVPKNTNPKEFKKLQQQIKENRRADKITSGPQSQILEGVSWEEAKKLQDANISATGDQVILVGAASKGIIQREFQHNATVYKTPYSKNPFDAMTDEELEDYKKVITQKQRGDYAYDEDQSESDAISSLPPSGKQVLSTSETEDDSTTHETRVIQVETVKVPEARHAEVLFSDDKNAQNSKHSNNVHPANSDHVREETIIEPPACSLVKVRSFQVPKPTKPILMFKSAKRDGSFLADKSSLDQSSAIKSDTFFPKILTPSSSTSSVQNITEIVANSSLDSISPEPEFITVLEVPKREFKFVSPCTTDFSSTPCETDEESLQSQQNYLYQEYSSSDSSISSHIGPDFENSESMASVDLIKLLSSCPLTDSVDASSIDTITFATVYQKTPEEQDEEYSKDSMQCSLSISDDLFDSISSGESTPPDLEIIDVDSDIECDREFRFAYSSNNATYRHKPPLSVIVESDSEALEDNSGDGRKSIASTRCFSVDSRWEGEGCESSEGASATLIAEEYSTAPEVSDAELKSTRDEDSLLSDEDDDNNGAIQYRKTFGADLEFDSDDGDGEKENSEKLKRLRDRIVFDRNTRYEVEAVSDTESSVDTETEDHRFPKLGVRPITEVSRNVHEKPATSNESSKSSLHRLSLMCSRVPPRPLVYKPEADDTINGLGDTLQLDVIEKSRLKDASILETLDKIMVDINAKGEVLIRDNDDLVTSNEMTDFDRILNNRNDPVEINIAVKNELIALGILDTADCHRSDEKNPVDKKRSYHHDSDSEINNECGGAKNIYRDDSIDFFRENQENKIMIRGKEVNVFYERTVDEKAGSVRMKLRLSEPENPVISPVFSDPSSPILSPYCESVDTFFSEDREGKYYSSTDSSSTSSTFDASSHDSDFSNDSGYTDNNSLTIVSRKNKIVSDRLKMEQFSFFGIVRMIDVLLADYKRKLQLRIRRSDVTSIKTATLNSSFLSSLTRLNGRIGSSKRLSLLLINCYLERTNYFTAASPFWLQFLAHSIMTPLNVLQINIAANFSAYYIVTYEKYSQRCNSIIPFFFDRSLLVIGDSISCKCITFSNKTTLVFFSSGNSLSPVPDKVKDANCSGSRNLSSSFLKDTSSSAFRSSEKLNSFDDLIVTYSCDFEDSNFYREFARYLSDTSESSFMLTTSTPRNSFLSSILEVATDNFSELRIEDISLPADPPSSPSVENDVCSQRSNFENPKIKDNSLFGLLSPSSSTGLRCSNIQNFKMKDLPASFSEKNDDVAKQCSDTRNISPPNQSCNYSSVFDDSVIRDNIIPLLTTSSLPINLSSLEEYELLESLVTEKFK